MLPDHRSYGGAAAPASPAQVNVIRLALLSGVVMFGAVVWFVRGSTPAPSTEESLRVLMYTFFGLLASMLLGAVLVKTRQLSARDRRTRVMLAIVGWAMLESVPMLGGVYFLLTGKPAAVCHRPRAVRRRVGAARADSGRRVMRSRSAARR
jgi:hypothetical protein